MENFLGETTIIWLGFSETVGKNNRAFFGSESCFSAIFSFGFNFTDFLEESGVSAIFSLGFDFASGFF